MLKEIKLCENCKYYCENSDTENECTGETYICHEYIKMIETPKYNSLVDFVSANFDGIGDSKALERYGIFINTKI